MPHANGATVDTANITFSWTAATGAQNYHFQISSTNDFSNDVVEYDFQQNGFVWPSLPILNLTGYWRVRAESGTEVGPYSDTWQFTTISGEDNMETTLSAPMLIAPINGSTITPTNVSFLWNAVSGADSYQVQISSTPDFSSDVGEEIVTETTLAVDALPA